MGHTTKADRQSSAREREIRSYVLKIAPQYLNAKKDRYNVEGIARQVRAHFNILAMDHLDLYARISDILSL